MAAADAPSETPTPRSRPALAATPGAKREAERLHTLKELGIVAATERERLDRAARVTAASLHVSVTLIGLKQGERMRIRACAGLDAKQARRGASLCSRVVSADGMEYRDVSVVRGLATHPLVSGEPGLRMLAGRPLRDPDGTVVGALVVGDTMDRQLGTSELALLDDLADWVEQDLVGERVHRTLQQMSRTIARLHQNEMGLRAVIDRVAEGIVTFTESGHILSTNEAADALFGTEPGELVGRNVAGLVQGGALWPHLSPLGERSTITGRRGDGALFPLELVVSEATIQGFRVLIGVGQDVSARERSQAALQASERRFRAIFDGAGIGMTLCDRQGRVVEANAALGELLGYDAEDLRGTGLHSLRHPDDIAAGRDAHAQLWAGEAEALRREVRYQRHDGSVVWAMTTASLIRGDDGEGLFVAEMAEDITRRKETERLKDEFVSVVGHELRTPLTSIRGSLGLIEGGVLGEVAPEAQRMLELARSNADRLVRLVNDMLDLERMDAGRQDFILDRLPARSLAEQTVGVVAAAAAEEGVELRVDMGAELQVRADADRIVQALVNLVGNAIKFSPAGSEVVLTARRDDDALVEFAVTDRGRGIPADQLDAVFERFRQVDGSDAREKGGTGLGLAIARGIVERHGGRIWAESREGQGTTFFFTLPSAEPGMMVAAG